MLPAGEPPPPRVIRFGPYEFDSASQSLTKHGLRLKIQGKPLQLLAALLENPGQTVGREELQKRLWPADTFVDFETGLNTAAKRLRAALSDSAEQPVYVETLARTGYRFIAPVQATAAVVVPSATAAPPAENQAARRQARWLLWPALGLTALSVAAVSFLAARAPHEQAPVTFRQLTFGRGAIFGAAFAPDGRSVVFSAQFDPAAPRQVYVNDGVSPESRALGLAGFSLAAVSAQGELALTRSAGTLPIAGGELFKVPMNGGVPVAVEKGVMSADWSADGRQLALVRAAQGRNSLEFPAGRVLHSTAGWLSHIRFSPDGRRIAFLDHPARHDDAGAVRMVDLQSGRLADLTRPWMSVRGLAWRGDGEIWFSAADSTAPASLWAASVPSGATRPLAQFPGTVGVCDVSLFSRHQQDGGLALLSRDSRRLESVAFLDNGRRRRDVSWLDWSRAVEIDNRGRILFDETGEAVGGRSTSFLSTGEGVARLGEGVAMGFSADGLSALLLDHSDRTLLRIVPFAGGTPKELPRAGLAYQWARFFPDGRRLLALASEAAAGGEGSAGGEGKALRLWTVVPGETPRRLTGAGMVRHAAISPRDHSVAYLAADGRLMLVGGDGGAAQELVNPVGEPLAPIQWSADGSRLYVQHLGPAGLLPARVSRLDIRRGGVVVKRQPWREFGPADPAGVDSVTRILISPDEQLQVATFRRILSELYLASGLR